MAVRKVPTMGRKDNPVIETPGPPAIGATLRQMRQCCKISLTEMAQQVHYSKSHLSNLENGRAKPSIELIEKYREIYGKFTDLTVECSYHLNEVSLFVLVM
jgi:transcriptional regulator with XRE-family HTH domain